MKTITIIADGIEYNPTQEEAKAVAIEKWYDRHRREWVIYPIDADGNQLREATYGFSKAEANDLQRELAAEYGL